MEKTRTELMSPLGIQVKTVHLTGDVSASDLVLATEALFELEHKDINRIYIDTTHISDLPKTSDLFHAIAALPYTFKIALLALPDSHILRKLQFIELTSFQKGKSIALVESKITAIEWLCEE